MSLANLSTPSFTGAELAACVNATLLEARAARRFRTAAALLADAGMTYGTGARPVAVGDRIQTAEGFAFDVVAAAATDHHVATAGGVRLRVVETPGVDVRAFGALGNNVADDTAAIQRMLDVMGFFRLPRGTFRVTAPLIMPQAGAAAGTMSSGVGMEQSVLMASGMGALSVITVSNPAGLYRFGMRDFAVWGDCNRCLDFPLTTGQLFQSDFTNLNLRAQAGDAFHISRGFSNLYVNVHIQSQGGHGFQIIGGNSNTLVGCYAHQINGAGRAGYRIHGNATLVGCNGLDSAGIWGIFGATTADGDAAGAVFRISMLQCNLDDFGTHALEIRNTGILTMEACSFVSRGSGTFETLIKANATGGASNWTLHARGNSFSSKGSTMTGVSRILTSGGPTLIEGDNVFTDYRNTGVSITYTTNPRSQSGPGFGVVAARFENLDAARFWGFVQQPPATWTANATTVSVAARNTVRTANTAATTFQTATGGAEGQRLTLIVADAFTTIQHNFASGGRFLLSGGTNRVCASGEVLEFVHNGASWVQV